MKNKLKIGNWKYVPDNQTLFFKNLKGWWYEIDLEKWSTLDWTIQVAEKTQQLKIQDVYDLIDIFEKVKEINPDLPVFHGKSSSNIHKLNFVLSLYEK